MALPKYVAFKGDNGKFLSLDEQDGHPYLAFDAGDKSSPSAKHEVVPVDNGNVTLKCSSNGKFWRITPTWVWADADAAAVNNNLSIFRPITLDPESVVLQSVANGKFCKRYTSVSKINCLGPLADYATEKFARLIAEKLE